MQEKNWKFMAQWNLCVCRKN